VASALSFPGLKADACRAPGQAYSWIAERVFYVAAAGLIQVNEVPAECGLVVETAEGAFEVLKRPRKRLVHLTPHHFMNLVLKPGGVTSELLVA
jgi:hypothetical protein